LIKALVELGRVKGRRFRRADKKLGYVRVLPPGGIRQKNNLLLAFLSKKLAE